MLKNFLKLPPLLAVTILVIIACISAPEGAETPAENLAKNTYYIDSQNGNDNYDGLSENTA